MKQEVNTSTFYLLVTALLSLCVEYCGSLCSPSVSKSPYLQTVGEDLLPNITVIWTGEMQTSKTRFYYTV